MVRGASGILETFPTEQIEHLYFPARSESINWELAILLGSVPITMSLGAPLSLLRGVLVTLSGDVSGNRFLYFKFC